MLETLKKATHSKEGHRQKLYDPVQDIENENKFAVHEHWHSNDDIEAHFQEQHFKDFAEQLQPYLAGPNALSIGKYHSVGRSILRQMKIGGKLTCLQNML